MKSKLHYGAALLIAVLLLAPAYSQAQTVGKPDGNVLNFFTTNAFGRLLGHREAGNFGFFATSDQWIGIGQPTVSPFSSTKVPAYGLRNQWEGQTGIFALKNASFGTTKDLAIEWGPDAGSRVRFSFIQDLADPTSLVEVMTLTPQQRVGVNNTSPFANLDVRGTSGFRGNTVIRGFYSGGGGFTTAVNGQLSSLSGISGTAISGSVSGTTSNMFGGNFRASSSSTSTSATTYGVFASASNSGPSTNTWAGYFSGDVYISGALTVASDRKFKENISELDKREVVSKLMKLTPSSYSYKSDENMTFTQGMQYGFIAQDVEKIFPDLVRNVVQPVFSTDESGSPQVVEGELIEFKSINYLGMVPILTKAIQEHEVTISAYEEKISKYESELLAVKKQNEELTEKFARLLTAIESNRSDLLQDVVEASQTSLGQNEPNPFGQSSRITYTLAKEVQNATIEIYNLDGKKVGDYQLDEGKNELIIEANTFEPGVYIYAMIADGKTIGTRRMIVSK